MSQSKLIVGVTHYACNNVEILPPSHVFENPEIGAVIFHEDPRVESSTNLANFDIHIDFTNGGVNTLHECLFAHRYLHIPKVSKKDQFLKMIGFNKNSPIKLKTPTVFMATRRNSNHKYYELPIANIGTPNCDKVVVKHSHGARGSNQLVIQTNMLQTVIKEAQNKDLTLGEIKELFPDIILTEGSDLELKLLDNYDNFVVTEYVPGIQKEWRLLVSGDEIYHRERVINEGEYPQANLNVTTYHNTPTVVYKPLSESSIPVEIIETLQAYVKYIKLPIGSLDLYIEEDGSFGIFEYSQQFAFHGADPAFIRKLHLDAVEFIITDMLSKGDK